jgi:hypothetical protein
VEAPVSGAEFKLKNPSLCRYLPLPVTASILVPNISPPPVTCSQNLRISQPAGLSCVILVFYPQCYRTSFTPIQNNRLYYHFAWFIVDGRIANVSLHGVDIGSYADVSYILMALAPGSKWVRWVSVCVYSMKSLVQQSYGMGTIVRTRPKGTSFRGFVGTIARTRHQAPPSLPQYVYRMNKYTCVNSAHVDSEDGSITHVRNVCNTTGIDTVWRPKNIIVFMLHMQESRGENMRLSRKINAQLKFGF